MLMKLAAIRKYITLCMRETVFGMAVVWQGTAKMTDYPFPFGGTRKIALFDYDLKISKYLPTDSEPHAQYPFRKKKVCMESQWSYIDFLSAVFSRKTTVLHMYHDFLP